MKNSLNVLLMDLDISKRHWPFPNLALMKLSAYHKAKGDQVFLNFPLQPADLTYSSCVFTWNAKRKITVPHGAIVGGSGINVKAELPSEVEHIMPDYTLYPSVNYSMGFTSRGCLRRCPWCIVPTKEGIIQPWATIYEFWDRQHQKIVLLDNNLLAAPNWKKTLEALITEGLEVDFNQGLDIRMLDEEKVNYLKRVKTRQLRFSFDDIAYEKAVREGIRLLTEVGGIRSRKLSFYVLYGFRVDEDVVERMKILAGLNVDVYPMAYRGSDGKEPKRSIIYHGSIMWHGPYRNKLKFLRLVGRLP